MGPSAASTSSRKPSTMRRIRSTSPPKSACPGVSTMLILVSPHRTAVFFERMVIPRSRSSGFESMTRSFTCWLARNTPAWRSIWSTSVVFPWSTCAMMAMLRICKGLGPDGADMRGAGCEGRSIGRWSRKDKRQDHLRAGRIPLHLHRHMPDAHAPQACLDGFEHALVVGRVLDDQVAAHRDHPARDGPHVEVVHRRHAGDGRDPVVDVREGDVRGRRLEQYVRALLHQPPGAAQDQEGAQHRDDGIGLHPPGGEDDDAREEGADRAEQVTHDMKVRAALVERVVVAAMQDRGPKGVGRQSYAGDD